MASNYGLGNDYDLSTGFSPVDLAGGAVTGKRVSMANVKSVDVVFIKAAGTAADDPVLTLKSHTASTGGVTTDLAVIEEYYVKSETLLDGDEIWAKVTQAAAATITDPGGLGTSAESEQIVVFNVRADQLPQTDNYISVSVADVVAAQVGTLLYVLHKHDKGDPTTFPAPLR